VVAYADDVTVFVTQPADFIILLQAVRCYEQAKGARPNPQKTKALAIGNWQEPALVRGIEFHEQVNIVEFTFRTTIANSTKDSWAGIIREVRAQARKAYAGNLCFTQRIKYAQLCLLAKIWYVAQILPLTKVHAQQLITVCTWLIWQDAIFRVPLTTLQRPKEQCGWALPDRGQMQDAPIQPNLDAQCKGRIRNSRVDAQLGSHRHTGEPPERERDPNQDGLHSPIWHT
jgi:hypothetical protein